MGRLSHYIQGLNSSGAITEVTVQNNYNTWNGDLKSLTDVNSGKILYQLQDSNAKGQVLNATLGKTRIYNTYDANGFLSNMDHQYWFQLQGAPSFLKIDYSFDAVKNELNHRYNYNFNIDESFIYDSNNRLVNWTNPKTGQMSYNQYDSTGRITYNDQLGEVGFNIGGNPYRSSSIKLNAQGIENYDMNGQSKLIQQIKYNENNDPVKIDGTRGSYGFAYGLSEGRQIMYYGGTFKGSKEALYQKYYSESCDAEIIVDIKNATERHILYIGGIPYNTDVIFTRNIGFDGGGYKFLHKDYLGSILAISDEQGSAEERRHYDAWGIFTHLQIKENSILIRKDLEEYLYKNTSLIVDRGYTSHEHLYAVELIHMNGRLYDPLLRRFLNADENIQDPTNSQSYNKYGYVVNNPLMFNDPSGEIAAGFFAAYVVPVIYGAIIGAAVGAGVYTIKSLITGNWTWSGFGKSILIGAATGAVSGGLSATYTATGFQGAVVMGSINGGVVGGVEALLTGKNFATGFYRGGLTGAAAGAVSYTVNYFASASYKTKYFSKSNEVNSENFTYDPNISRDVMQSDINTMRSDNFTKVEIQKFGIGTDQIATENVDLGGYLNPGNGPQYAFTTPKNFLTGLSNITYSPIAAQNKALLALTMVHETGHAYGNALGLIDVKIDRNIYNISYSGLDTTQHFAIGQLEHVYANYNLLNYSNRPSSMFFDYMDVTNIEYYKLSTTLRALVDSTYGKLLPVFQRFMYYNR